MFHKRLAAFFLISISIFAVVSRASAQPDYDFVVVGAGAGGGPLASRLARAGHRVLLLEAGTDTGAHLTYQVPLLYPLAIEDPRQSWEFYVNHYSDPAQASRNTKLVCKNALGAIRRCVPTTDGGCACPRTHPTPKGILYPRASALGGSTTHHSMTTVLPKNSDWDYIAELTADASWHHESMNPYWDRVEQWFSLQPNDPDVLLGFEDEKLQGIIRSAVEASDPPNLTGDEDLHELLSGDLNEALQQGDGAGAWPVPLGVERGQRNGVRELILDTACLPDVADPQDLQKSPAQRLDECRAAGLIDPATGLPYLTVKTGALVTRVLFAAEPTYDPHADGWECTDECRTAIGVEYIDSEHVYRADPLAPKFLFLPPPKRTVEVQKEVILSAGTYNTPQLLMLSGLGPREELRRADLRLPVRVDLPGVGKNLQDRYEVSVVAEIEGEFKTLNDCNLSFPFLDPCLAEWLETKHTTGEAKGLYTTNGLLFALLRKSSSDKPEEDLHIFGVMGDFWGWYPGFSLDVTQHKNRWSWTVLKGHTENRGGTVTLRSTDPLDTPHVNFHYFEEGDAATAETGTGSMGSEQLPSQRDLQSIVEGVKFVRHLLDEASNSGVPMAEIRPGPDVASDAEIADWVRDQAWGHHVSSSARLGAESDPMAVLDSEFRVRNTQGLRVVDASVFPRIPGTFIVSAVYMVSEKAADVIVKEYDQ